MPVKLRLQRRGRTHYSEFAIVAIDSRQPRDGKFIEKLGNYNPNTNPATIKLDFQRALYWVQQGAPQSDTVRAILSYKGVLMYDHLLRGVKKGAFDEEEAKKRFEEWKKQKQEKIDAKKSKIAQNEQKQKDELLKKEKEVNQKRAEELSERLKEEAEEEQEQEQEEEKEEKKEDKKEEQKGDKKKEE